MRCPHYLAGLSHGEQGISYKQAFYQSTDEEIGYDRELAAMGCACYHSGWKEGHDNVNTSTFGKEKHDPQCDCSKGGVIFITQQ